MATRSPHAAVVKRLLLFQAVIALVFPLAMMAYGMDAALSAAAGASAGLFPNLYFASQAFRYSGARASHKILQSFYFGETMKILMTAIIFALCFKYLRPLNVSAMFGGFIVVQLAVFTTPLLANR